jgi:hypothetical protein
VAAAASSPGSCWSEVVWEVMTDLAGAWLAPPPLDGIPDGTMLAVAAVPGKVLEEWRHAAFGVWIGWPHAVDAVHAEEMTAGQLRALLAERDHG